MKPSSEMSTAHSASLSTQTAGSTERPTGRDDVLTFSKVKEMLDSMPPRPPDPFALSLFGGERIIEVEDRYEPVIKLRAECPVSDEFRYEMNAWLVEMFGVRDVTPMKRGIALRTAFGFIIRKSDAVSLLA